VLPAGLALGPGEVGMLAALGRARVPVTRRPRVVVLCTGDELCPVGDEPAPGQIFSSNEHALAAQVAEAGGELARALLVADDRAPTEAAVTAALACDALVTSGGVSVGDRDHVRDALAAAGVAIDFWKVAMRPGKPVVFGVAPSGALCFGLPGNPASALVSFELFVRPALLAMQGAAVIERPRADVTIIGSAHKSPGRAHYLRASLRRRGDALEAVLHPKQGSGMLSSLVGIDALVELAAELGDTASGARCPALLLRPA
jgi:molybdopterin molybdotransferase